MVQGALIREAPGNPRGHRRPGVRRPTRPLQRSQACPSSVDRSEPSPRHPCSLRCSSVPPRRRPPPSSPRARCPAIGPAFVAQTDVRPDQRLPVGVGSDAHRQVDERQDHPEAHQRLRALSGDRGGSNLADLKKAYKKLGINLKFSPNGGERITYQRPAAAASPTAPARSSWATTAKLRAGTAAGTYGFWKMTKKEKKKHPSRDNHAGLRRALRPSARTGLADGPAREGRLARRVDQHLGAPQVRLEQRRCPVHRGDPDRQATPFAHVTTSAANLSLTRPTPSRRSGRSGRHAAGTSRA